MSKKIFKTKNYVLLDFGSKRDDSHDYEKYRIFMKNDKGKLCFVKDYTNRREAIGKLKEMQEEDDEVD